MLLTKKFAGRVGALPVLQQLPTAWETSLFRFQCTFQKSAMITRSCLSWVGGEKRARGRGAGGRHCPTLKVLLKGLPTAAQESGRSPPSQRFRSFDEMSYSKDLSLSIPPPQQGL